MNVAVEDGFEPGEPFHIGGETRQGVRITAQRTDERFKALGEEAGDVDPPWIVLHLGGSVELERLILDVETQSSKGLLIALEERWRLATGDPVQRGDSLLPVQNQHPDGGSPGEFAPNGCAVRLGLPGQQPAY